MTDAALWEHWWTWLVVALVVVLVAAGLLVSVWLTARAIRREARRALVAVEAIRTHTQAIWMLQTTNDLAAHVADTVGGLQRKSAMLAGALNHEERHAK